MLRRLSLLSWTGNLIKATTSTSRGRPAFWIPIISFQFTANNTCHRKMSDNNTTTTKVDSGSGGGPKKKKITIFPIAAKDVAASVKGSSYPSPFRGFVQGRTKSKLGDAYGLSNFGVNYTTLKPGAFSALSHHHSKQDEFLYIIEGTATLYLGSECDTTKTSYTMEAGDCMGFHAGQGVAHRLANESEEAVVYLEVGDRTPDDEVEYPDNDLKAVPGKEGTWKFLHKDGTPYV